LDFGVPAFYTGSRLYDSCLGFPEFLGIYACFLTIVVLLILTTSAISSKELQGNSSIE